MNKKILTAAVVLAAMGGCAATAAETPVYTLDVVVVTANRTETKELDTNADVSVVTAKDIEQHHYKDVSEAIKNVPGVTMVNQGANGQTYFSNMVYINGSKNVVLLVDGIRQNISGLSVGSHAQVGNYTSMDSIDRIEVLKGSASTLYGSDAQGGVINIITKKPEDGTMKTKMGASFGSYNGENYNFTNEGAQNGFFWQIGANKQLQGDFKDGWGRKVINHLNAKGYDVKLGKNLGNDSDLTFTYQKYKTDYIIPKTDKNGNFGSFITEPAQGNKNVENLALQYKSKVNDRLDTKVSAYRNQLELNDFSNGIFEFKTQTTGISNQWTYALSNQTIVGGIDYYKDEVKHYLGNGNDPGAEGKSISNTAFYLQDIWNLTNEWSITPGIRVDHNSKFGNHISPSFVIGYKPSNATNYYLSYKTFFIAPDMYQMYAKYKDPDYGSVTEGNPNLKPEEGYTYELGVHHQFDDSLFGTFSVYKQHAKNRIAYWSNDDYSYGSYENTGRLDSWGVNAKLNKRFNRQLGGYIGYSYMHIDGYVTPTGLKISGNGDGELPQSILNVGLNYSNAKLNASIDGQGIMNRYGSKSHPVMRNYANFWIWNISANYQVRPHVNVFAKINNIFDQFYTTTTSYVTGPDLDPAGSYQGWFSAPGRNYEVGASFQF